MVAAKSKRGNLNASMVSQVGNGAMVATAILDGPIAGSEYGGYFREITVKSAYPISRWEPPDPDDPESVGRWIRVRTATHVVTRLHTGPDIADTAGQITFEETVTPGDFDLDDYELVIPGSDEDIEDFGPGFLDINESSVEVSGALGKNALLAWAEDLPDEWQTYYDAALNCPSFSIYGDIAAGLILRGGYDEEDYPFAVERITVNWAGSVIPSSSPLSGVSAPMIAAPGLELKAGYYRYDIDLTEENPEASADELSTEVLPWSSFGFWTSAVTPAEPDSGGFNVLDAPDAQPGFISMVGFYDWWLDLAPKIHA